MEPTDEQLVGAMPAATVLIARDGATGLELLVIERARGMGFAAGAIAFPGGKVDAGDAAQSGRLAGFQGLPDGMARVTAAREVFEESGVLLSAGPAVDAGTRAMLREQSDRHAIRFVDLLEQIDHRLDASVMKPFARWLPPVDMLHARFDTRFYLALLPEGEAHLADGHEAVLCRWARPADLLAEADSGQISLLFPTRCVIARAARFDSAAMLWTDSTPPAFVQPTVSADGWISIGEGLGYPYWRERLDRARRG